MLLKHFLTSALGLAFALSIWGKNSSPLYSTADNQTQISTPKGIVTVTAIDDDIFRVSTLPKSDPSMLLPRSQSAILNADGTKSVKLSRILTPTSLIIASNSTRIHIDRLTGRVSFLDSDNRPILQELSGVNNSSPLKSISFASKDIGNLYGAGERGHSLRLNSDSLTFYNRQNYGYTGGDSRISQMGISVPYIVSDRGFGLLFDDYNSASLSTRDSILYLSETPKPLSYYFINGDGSMKSAVSNYTRLTGRQPLPPIWALGYITSKYGYRTQQEALGAVDSLRRRGYPLDGIVFDLYWYGKETDMGRLEWNREQFPNHRMMLDSLNKMGVNTILISQPYINKIGAINNYNALAEKGMLTRDSLGATHDVTTWVGEAGMFDISNPDTRQWLWNRLQPLTAEGLAGWWGDLGEPEVHPLSIRHANGETASQFHNVYGNEWSRLIYEGMRRDFPDKRPVLLMRGGTAGLQRYAVMPWTTDVSRSWGGLQPQINLMLSSGLSGIGYISSDIGGFAVDKSNPVDAELYLRWLQMGVFTPVLRTHSSYKPEPYHYPEYETILKRFIRARYEWLPYNYTLAWENATDGTPLARPLNFYGGQDSTLINVQDEYLWGKDVLIAPILKAQQRVRKVIFPAGEWINWNKPTQRFRGGTTATIAAPLSEMPIFVRAGSFIPQYSQPIQNTTEYDPSSLTVKYFPSTVRSNYTLYEDDRKSPESIANNEYTLTTFEGQKLKTGYDISISSKGAYQGMSDTLTLRLEIIDTNPPKTIIWNQKGNSEDILLPKASSPKAIRQYGWCYDKTSRTLSILIPYNRSTATLSIRQ